MSKCPYCDGKLAIKPKQAAELLELGGNSIYDAIKKGVVPSVKIGNRIRVPLRQLLELVEGAADQSKDEDK